MFELKVLAALIQSRKEYESIRHRVQDLSPLGRATIKVIDEYYAADPAARSVDLELLTAKLKRQFGDVPKHLRDLTDYLTELTAVDVSAVNVAKEVLESEQERVGIALADAILTKNTDMIQVYLSEYEAVLTQAVEEADDIETYTGADLSEFADLYDEANLIRVAPPALNERLRGGMIRGQHIILAAMPEVGKSLFAINMAAGFIRQGYKVLYIGNEDPLPELIMRLLCNLSGVLQENLFDNKEHVMTKAREYGYDNITFKGLDPGDIGTIDRLMNGKEYDVLIIDQLRNITAKTENNTQRLEAVAVGARNLARRHNVLVVSVTQAAESARDNLILNSGDIDGSNIGMPGACDVMVMVGVNDDFYQRDLRKLTLTKNKRGGIHDSFTVSIDRWRSRVKNFGGTQ